MGFDQSATNEIDGQDISPGSVETDDETINNSVTYPGGATLSANPLNWEEDANSPFTASSVSSKQFTLASNWDRVLLVPSADNVGFDQIRVNGDSGANYNYTDNSDTSTTGANQWELNDFMRGCDSIVLQSNHSQDVIGIGVRWAIRGTGKLVYGVLGSKSPPINTFTVLDSGNSNRSVSIEAYGVDIA